MDGLEAAEVKLSELERTKRIDAEFFNKENLKIAEILNLCKTDNLTNLSDVSDGNHMEVSSKFQDTGIPYFRGQDIHSFFIEMSNAICIDNKTYNLPYMRRSHLKNNDVLLSIVGTIGKVAIYTGENEATCNCKLAILRAKNINAEFLSIFLQSKYGNNQIVKYTRGAVQMGFILEDMQQIKVPIFSDIFVGAIRQSVLDAKKTIKLSENVYTSAQDLLLSEIGLSGHVPTNETVSIKTLSNSFGTSGRLDAEYYQPKYDEVIGKITNYKGGFGELDNYICNYSTGFPYKSEDYVEDGEYKLIRINNIVNGFLDTTNSATLKSEIAMQSPKDLVNIGDIIISMSGTIGSACCITEDIKAVINQRILRITSKNYSNLVLMLFLNSLAGYSQFERIGTGGVQTNISSVDMKSILIPNLPQDIQQHIENKVQQSFNLRKKSIALLKHSKKAIEMAIEQGEDEAIAWLENVTLNML